MNWWAALTAFLAVGGVLGVLITLLYGFIVAVEWLDNKLSPLMQIFVVVFVIALMFGVVVGATS